MILAIKTDSPIAELYLFDGDKQAAKDVWEAGNKLSLQLNEHVENLLGKDYKKLTGIVVFQGPGSFTGLRIGITVANTLAYSLEIPIVGSTGENWLKNGVKKIKTVKRNTYVMPEYGAPPNITKPRK